MRQNNVIRRADGIIEIVVKGDQTIESIQAIAHEVIPMSGDMVREGKKVLILDNLMQAGAMTPDARALVFRLMKQFPFDRFAMVSNKGAIRIAGNLMLQATGKGSKTHFFTDYREAEQWLQAA